MSIGDMKIFNPIPDFHQEMLGPIANSAYTHFIKDAYAMDAIIFCRGLTRVLGI